MQVTAAQVRKSVNAKYILWDGEMIVRVHQHTGAHGFHSAAIVIIRCDDPVEVRSANWYDGAEVNSAQPMLEWVAQQLSELSTGTGLNLGGVGNVEGLCKV